MSLLLALLAIQAVTLAANQGIIKSDNYPQKYAPNTQKRFIIQATDGNQLNFVFQSPFHIEGSGSQCFDYVQILDSSAENTQLCNESAVPFAKFCSFHAPPNLTLFTSADAPPIRAIVEFCTDSNMEFEGFSLEWFASGGQTTPPVPATTSVASGQRCGVQAKGYEPIGVNGTDKIIGGIHARPHSWPWAAGIFQTHGSIVKCGATLINKRWLLSAGHCFTVPSDAPYFRIKLGADDRGNSTDPNEPTQQVLKIEKLFIHPNYSDPTHSHDLSLIKLEHDVEINEFVRPICLPEATDALNTGDMAVAIGWGLNENGEEPQKLMQVVVPIIDQKVCEKDLGKLDETQICAGNEENGGIDACQGDSGGAFMAPVGDVWKLMGAVSWGNLCGAPHEPGVYAYVPSMFDWIEEILGAKGGGDDVIPKLMNVS